MFPVLEERDLWTAGSPAGNKDRIEAARAWLCRPATMVWFYYWGKLCTWCQNVKCVYACRCELTRSLGVGHESWSFEKRRKPVETDPSHTDTYVWVRTVHLKKVTSNTKWKVTNMFVIMLALHSRAFLCQRKVAYINVFRWETFVYKRAHDESSIELQNWRALQSCKCVH